MRDRTDVDIGPLALMLLALAYYLMDGRELLAVLLPIFAHELGHIVCLRALGLRVWRLRLELSGLCIDYAGCTSSVGRILSAGAGPAAGLLYALIAAKAGLFFQSSWMELSGGISLVLSFFNLLPVQPMDGGRITEVLLTDLMGRERGELICRWISLAAAALLLAVGAWAMFAGWGIGLELAAIWMLAYQNCGKAIVKRKKIV